MGEFGGRPGARPHAHIDTPHAYPDFFFAIFPGRAYGNWTRVL